MGFFGGVFKILGFESDGKSKKGKNIAKATYKLNDKRSKRIEQIDGVSVYYPENLEQVSEFLDFVKDGKPIIISFQDCDKEKEKRIVDFMNGFAMGANAKIVDIGDKMTLILPEGIEIEE